jgi:hypothetical protein
MRILNNLFEDPTEHPVPSTLWSDYRWLNYRNTINKSLCAHTRHFFEKRFWPKQITHLEALARRRKRLDVASVGELPRLLRVALLARIDQRPPVRVNE